MLARIVAIGLGVLLFATAWAGADSILLDDGTILSGTIVSESTTRVTIETEVGRKTIPRRRIKSIVRDEESSLPRGTLPPSVMHFYNLEPLHRELINVQAMYDQADRPSDEAERQAMYRAILSRIAPHLDPNDERDEQYELRWVAIDSHLRLKEFTEAIDMLETLKEHGRELDRIRATAYLDILEQNRDEKFSLRRVNDRYTRDFLERRDRIRAKAPGALAERDLMEAALEEYCYQILTDEEASVSALTQEMQENWDLTLEALREMPPLASRMEEYLPFRETLRETRENIERVNAILPEYGRSYHIDLVREVSMHIYFSLTELFLETMAEHEEPQLQGDERGELSRDERVEWREYCIAFREDLQPLRLIAEYVRERVAAYPNQLRQLNQQYDEIISRLEGIQIELRRKQDRTHV